MTTSQLATQLNQPIQLIITRSDLHQQNNKTTTNNYSSQNIKRFITSHQLQHTIIKRQLLTILYKWKIKEETKSQLVTHLIRLKQLTNPRSNQQQTITLTTRQTISP